MPQQRIKNKKSSLLNRLANVADRRSRSVKFVLFGLFVISVAGVGAYLTFFSHANTQTMVNGRIVAYTHGGAQDPNTGAKLFNLNTASTPVTSTSQKLGWTSGSVLSNSAISPNGERIAQVEQAAAGGEELVTRRLIDGGDRVSLFTANRIVDIRWSPDSTKLALTQFLDVAPTSPQANGSNIVLVDIKTRNSTHLTQVNSQGEQHRLQAYLKDGRIVYTYSIPSSAGITKIYTMTSTGASKTLQMEQPRDVHFLSFSYTTGKMAFNTFTAGSKTYGVTTLNMDGSNKKTYTGFPVETIGGPGKLSWSPDEKYIVTDNEVINAATGTVATTLGASTYAYGWQAVPLISSNTFTAKGNDLDMHFGVGVVTDSPSPSNPVARITAKEFTGIGSLSAFRHYLNTYAGKPVKVCVTARNPIATQPARVTLTNLAGTPQTFILTAGSPSYETFCNTQTSPAPGFAATMNAPKVTAGTTAFVLVSAVTVTAQ